MPIGYGIDTVESGPAATARRKADLDAVFDEYMNRKFGGVLPSSPATYPQGQPQANLGDGGPGGLSFRSFGGGGGRVPSPGGLDLNALLSRGIAGNIAGAQEETGIKRRQAAGDLLSQQLAQAAQELQNRMQGYEFGTIQDFDAALRSDPRLAATLTDLARQQGVDWMTSPTSRRVLEAFGQFQPGVASHQERAASILKNWTASGAAYGDMPEPPEVAWARNVLRVGGATTRTGTNAPSAAPAATSKQNQVPYGFGRAAAAGGVQGLGYVAGAKGLTSAVSKLAPKLASRLPGWAGPVAGLITAGLAGTGYNALVDPRALEAEAEHPFAAGLSTAGTATAANRLRARMMSAREAGVTGHQSALGGLLQEHFERSGGLRTPPARTTPLALPPPSTGPSATGGPQMGDFVRRFKTFYGRNPTQQELEHFSRGGAPTASAPGPLRLNAPPKEKGPYKPKVKGYEEFLQKQFGQ